MNCKYNNRSSFIIITNLPCYLVAQLLLLTPSVCLITLIRPNAITFAYRRIGCDTPIRGHKGTCVVSAHEVLYHFQFCFIVGVVKMEPANSITKRRKIYSISEDKHGQDAPTYTRTTVACGVCRTSRDHAHYSLYGFKLIKFYYIFLKCSAV